MSTMIVLEDFDFSIAADQIAAVRFRDGRTGTRIPKSEYTFFKMLWRALRGNPPPKERFITRYPTLTVFFKGRDEPHTYSFYEGTPPADTDIDAWSKIEAETKATYQALVRALSDRDEDEDAGLARIVIRAKTPSEQEQAAAQADVSQVEQTRNV